MYVLIAAQYFGERGRKIKKNEFMDKINTFRTSDTLWTKPQDGAPINITSDKRFSIIGGGSHNFVRNVAGYAQLLAEEGKLRLDTKSD